MTHSPTHSPLPWNRTTGDIVDNASNLICDFVPDVDNANFIVKAVNNHDSLVNELSRCVRALEAVSATIPFQGKINSMAHATVDDAKMRAEELLKQIQDGE